ncbi:MAG: hypothetical protein ACJAZT_001400, partial [Gammaproteobacteria bacterium]
TRTQYQSGFRVNHKTPVDGLIDFFAERLKDHGLANNVNLLLYSKLSLS